MPQDLFELHGINPSAQSSQPQDLFLARGINTQQPSFLNNIGNMLQQGILNVGGGLGHGLAQGIANIANIPRDVFGVGPQVNVPNAPFSNPNSLLYQGASAVGQTAPMAATLEAQLPALGGTLGSGVLSAAGSAALTTPGSAQDRAMSGVEAGLGTGALAGVGKGASYLGGTLKDYLSKFAGPGIGNNIVSALKESSNIDNNEAFQLAAENYNKHTDYEKSLWNALSNKASEVDQNPKVSFNNDSYKDALSKKLSELKGQSSRQSGYQRANNDSLNMLQGYLKDQHETFTDAIEHNKALNQDYTNEITPGKSLPFSTVNFAKQNIKKAIDKNFSDNPEASQLGDLWKNANQVTSEKNKIFNEIASGKGVPKISSFSAIMNKKAEFTDPSTFVDDYLPSSKSEGIQKMQQFGQMLGNDDSARSVIKKNYFKSALNDSGINMKSVVNKYNNLSEQQKSYLFSPNEIRNFDALNKILSKDPSALSNSLVSHNVWAHIMPAIFGGGIGFESGHPFLGALLGWGAGGLGAAATRQAFSNPLLQKMAMNHLLNPSTTSTMANALNRSLPYGSAATAAALNQGS